MAKASAPKPAIKTVSKSNSKAPSSPVVTGEKSVRKNIAGEYDGASVEKLQQKLLSK